MDINKGKNSQFVGEITIKASPPIYILFTRQHDLRKKFKTDEGKKDKNCISLLLSIFPGLSDPSCPRAYKKYWEEIDGPAKRVHISIFIINIYSLYLVFRLFIHDFAVITHYAVLLYCISCHYSQNCHYSYHWCIKSIYIGFAIAKDCTFKLSLLVLVLFNSCLFSESPFGYLGKVREKNVLQWLAFFFRNLRIFKANLYTP